MELKKSAYPHHDVTYGRDWTDSEELIDNRVLLFTIILVKTIHLPCCLRSSRL